MNGMVRPPNDGVHLETPQAQTVRACVPDPLLLRACSVHAGGRYRNRKDSATPPSDGWEVNHGTAPAPRLRWL